MSEGALTSIRRVKIALAILYVLACAFIILVSTEGDYEWMIGEREPDGSILTLCTIPASTDSTSDMAIPALILIAVLFVPGLILLMRERRVSPSLALSLLLLTFWAYRFFGRTAFC